MANLPVQARAFMEKFGLRQPLVLAPMMGASTPKLVAAVKRAGGLGFYGGGTVSREDGLEAALTETWREMGSSGPSFGFGVDLMVPSGFFHDRRLWTPAQRAASEEARRRHLLMLHELDRRGSASCLGPKTGSLLDNVNLNTGVGLETVALRPVPNPSNDEVEDAEFSRLTAVFEAQIDLLIEQRIPVVSFHFGWPEPRQVAKLKSEGVFLIGKATSAREAKHLVEEGGADCVVAQGSEAGGHTGKFLDGDEPTPSTLQLTREVAAALPSTIPIISAGGLMNGADIAEALKAGASAGMLGTAFLTTQECHTAKAHREALLASAAEDTATRLTRVFTGKPARTLVVSRYVTQTMGDLEARLPNCFNGMPLGRVLQKAASSAGETDVMYMWAGANWAKSRKRGKHGLSAEDLVRQLEDELREALAGHDPAVEEGSLSFVQQREPRQPASARL